MIKFLCNLIFPGLGSLFMRKPITGLIQLILFVIAVILLLSVFLTFLGIMLWAFDVLWALFVSIQWWRGRNKPHATGPNPNEPTLAPRLCDCSEGARLNAFSHNWDLYNAVTKYRCGTCGIEVAVVPLMHIGYTLSVGMMAIFMVSYFYIWPKKDPSFWIYALVASMAIFQAAMTFAHIAPHAVYPVFEPADDGIQSPNKSFRWQERYTALFKGIALPFLVIALLLGCALIMGFAYDHYFPKP